ncbi:protein kinase-like domain [Pochonia chlamydosporia 170]|uniref:Protein kinase-like domain n=1 Tax=Pochonia chlamydosporia 170 TaxID=1380566 RepID=A0A179FXB0_METCM|nr:protein kinase-like domain [Pochonia chlamydosporia 170]OAQ70305.1 protein kinase-like domain [Pochonia chlamydosporia 170]
MAPLRSLLLGGTVWCLLASRAISASTNQTSSAGCHASDKDFGPPFNTTGTASFNLGSVGYKNTKPWYLTIGLKDRRDLNASYTGTQTVNSYVSLPDDFINRADGNYTQMCAYRLVEQNSTAAEGNGSCMGVLSDACTKYIQTFQESTSFSDGKCPEFSPGKGCGDSIFQLAIPTNFTSTNCSTSGLPGVAEIPQNYTTRGLFGIAWSIGDKEINSFDAYDLHVRQPNPILLVFGYNQGYSQDNNHETIYVAKLFCVAPDHVAAGSRDPKSSAIELRVNKAMVLAMAAMSFVMCIL